MPEEQGSKYKSPVLGLKGGLWVLRKNHKISTASDQYFLSYVKKTTGGGVKLTPHPAGIGLMKNVLFDRSLLHFYCLIRLDHIN